MPFASAADGTRAALHRLGNRDARPVLLVHGFGSGQAMWNGQIPGLVAAGLRCVTFDRRGHGRSDVPGRGYDLDTLAGDIAAVARQLNLVDVVLVGHSLGGAEAIRYLAAHADGRVRRAGARAPRPPRRSAGAGQPGRDRPRPVPPGPAGDASTTPARRSSPISAEDFLGPGHAVSALQSDATRRQLVDLPLPVLLATFDTNAAADLRADLAAIDVPTLVIQGDADKNNPLELTGRRAAELIPDAALVILAGAGHGLYRSEAARYTAEIVNFARTVPAVLAR